MKNTIYTISSPKNEETIKIGIATTSEEKREVYRLRYTIYAEEIAYNLMSVDHRNRLLYDEMDDWGILFYAQVGSTLIATARTNIGKLENFPSDIVETYSMTRFKKFYDEKDNPNFAVISKGMIAPQYRNSPVLKLFMKKHYELYCDHQVQFAFVSCNFYLIPLHEYFGSRRIDKNILYLSYGPVSNLVMLVDDAQHLQAVGSPLFDIAKNRSSLNIKVVDWFNSEFSAINKITVNSQLVTADLLWAIICQYLGGIPTEILSMLKNLSVSEAKLFLHSCSTIVHCHARDYITMGGNTSQEMIILLSGTAHSSSHGTILPGQFCGENGLVHRTTHSASVIATKDSNILVLSFHYFNKFRKQHPAIARKVLNNLPN